MFHLTPDQSTWVLVVSVIGAFVGYQLSENDRRKLGRTPWGLPSLLWALFWFLSLLVAIVLYLIAHSAGVRRARQGPPSTGQLGAMGTVAPGRPTVAEQFPAYPRPANLGLADGGPIGHGGAEVGTSTEGVSARPDDNGPESGDGSTASPPAWHADPSGRFHYRWWDGQQWTSQVSMDGQHLIDTNPDQRIGPY